MAYKCDYCNKTFETLQALASHVTYKHKRVKPLEKITTIPTPPEILQDPQIIALRKEYEIRRLRRAIEEMEEVPKTIELAERVTKLEEVLKKFEDFKYQLDKFAEHIKNLTEHIRVLKNDNENHKIILCKLLILAYANNEDIKDQLFLQIREEIKHRYGLEIGIEKDKLIARKIK